MNFEQLIEILKEGTLYEKILAYKLKKDGYSTRAAHMIYYYLLSLIDNESSKELKQIDNIILACHEEFYDRNSLCIDSYGCAYEENGIKKGIKRDESGYFAYTETGDEDPRLSAIIEHNSGLLQDLHNAYSRRKEILSGNFKVNSCNYDVVNAILLVLGYDGVSKSVIVEKRLSK